MFRYTIKLLLISSFLELVLNRTISRLGMHIPAEIKGERVIGLLKGLSVFNLFIENLSTILGLLALMLVLRIYSKSREMLTDMGRVMISILGIIFIGWSVISLWIVPNPLLSISYSLIFLTIIGIIVHKGLARSNNIREKWAIICLVGGSLCYNLYKIIVYLSQSYNLDIISSLSGFFYRAGELLMVVAILAVFFAYTWPVRISKSTCLFAFIASTIFIGYLGVSYLNPSILPILSIWSLGYTSFLPVIVYAAILGLLTYTLLKGLWEEKISVYGITFIFISGYTMLLSYQYILALLGFALLPLKGTFFSSAFFDKGLNNCENPLSKFKREITNVRRKRQESII